MTELTHEEMLEIAAQREAENKALESLGIEYGDVDELRRTHYEELKKKCCVPQKLENQK